MGTVDYSTQAGADFYKTKNVFQKSFQKLRQVVEDSMIRLKNLERIPGVNLDSEALSPWQTKQLMSARKSARLSILKTRADNIVSDITSSAKQTGVKADDLRKDVNEFLRAEHAPERNARVGKEAAAGITDKEASEKLAELSQSENFTQIKEIAEKMRDLNSEVLDTLLENGLITKKLFKELREDYKKHVPLMRVMDDKLTDTISVMGNNLDVKQSGIQSAKGSLRDVEDILENIVLNYEKAIGLAERNRFGKSLMDFAKDNSESGFFKVLSDSASINPNDPRYFGVRVDGKQKWVFVDDHNLGAALRGINMDKMPGVLKFAEVFSRTMSQLATFFNPDYLLTGFTRDTQEMIVSAAASKEIAATGALKRLPQSQAIIIKHIRGIDDVDTQLYQQFISDGGGMGGMALSTKREGLAIDLAQHKGKGKEFAKSVVSKIDSLQEVFENANRFSVYQEALEKGLSRDKAALLSQESTINFSRKGTGGPIINGLYMFANASIQVQLRCYVQ